ncbi:MAG: LLM class flavin-dependent oxidoreductase [Alphaproteobacteria bacterium]|nr:LLM class flavin-dependent oxidoreductase [Alphaproteobacteria bacterium]
MERKRPALAIKEAITVIRGLLAGERVNFQGEIVRFDGGQLIVRARADIPIIVGSRGDLVLQAAGEVADGVLIATYAEPVGIGHAKAMIAEGAAKAGRSMDDLTLISRIDTCINADRRMAYEVVKPSIGIILWASYPDRKFVHRVGLEVPAALEALIAKRDYNLMEENAHLIPDAFVDKYCWAGTVEDVARKIAAVMGEGVRDLTIMPLAGHGDSRIDVARAFVEDVVPMAGEIAAGP